MLLDPFAKTRFHAAVGKPGFRGISLFFFFFFLFCFFFCFVLFKTKNKRNSNTFVCEIEKSEVNPIIVPSKLKNKDDSH